MADAKYTEAPEHVYETLMGIFREYSEMQIYQNFNYKVLYSEKEKRSKGRKILGKISVFGEVDTLLHEHEVLIVLDASFCKGFPGSIKPLLYHELCHLHYDEENLKLGLVGHDVEEFSAVLRRFGDWQGDLTRFNAANLQYQLDLTGIPSPSDSLKND
jgi:Putative phage metallopeptidase